MPLAEFIRATTDSGWGAVALLAFGALGLIRYGLRIRFLWRVYVRGGRVDMKAAADALRRSGPTGLRSSGRAP